MYMYMPLQYKTTLIELMRKCVETDDISKRTELVQYLNRLLPLKYKIQLPSLITNDYLDMKIYLLEENFA